MRPKVSSVPYCDPFKLFLELVERGYPVKLFLDSANPNPVTGRFSFLAVGAAEELVLKDDKSCFEKLKAFYDSLSEDLRVEGLPYGLFGYLSYDANRFIEKVPSPFLNDLQMPDLHFFLPEILWAFDHLKKKAWLISLEKFSFEPKGLLHEGSYSATFYRYNMDRDYFKRAVEKIKEYIANGDSFQVNFSQRIDVLFEGSAVELYKRLRALNPSPFSFYLDLGEFKAVSCSPERLVKVEGGVIETRPIAGTRRRGRTEAEDELLRQELFLSEKERAEHVMLVDLERNDLGKVCRYGTVEVNELMVPEFYSHVIHIVSNVRGILREGVHLVDALKALFPGGTITGAPKVRTMEIIAELEPTWRNLYTGSVGYLGFNGVMDFNIVIRTLLLKGYLGALQVGAGIVWDSVADKEYEETLHKGRALLEALGVRV